MSAFDPKRTFSPIPLDANHCCNRLHLSLNRRGPKPRGADDATARVYIASRWRGDGRGQPSARMRLIGVLLPIAKDDPDYQPWLTAFRQALQELGWVDGRNMRMDVHWATANHAEIRRRAIELLAFAPDVILAHGGTTVGPLLQATRTVPIVFPIVVDPVGA